MTTFFRDTEESPTPLADAVLNRIVLLVAVPTPSPRADAVRILMVLAETELSPDPDADADTILIRIRPVLLLPEPLAVAAEYRMVSLSAVASPVPASPTAAEYRMTLVLP